MRGEILIEKAETGKPTLILKQPDGSLAVYSRHDPERDGLRFYQKQNRDHGKAHSGLLFFIGIGLGYHISPFAEDPGVERIVILEPDEALFQKVKNTEPVNSLISRDRVEIHVGKEIDLFLGDIESRYDYIFYRAFHVVRYQRLHQIYLDIYGSLERRLHTRLNSLLSDASTIGRFAVLWLNNYIRNIQKPGLVRSVSALFGRYSGTAVVLGAGPSLGNVLNHLKSDRSGLYLIATDAALKPLFRWDIRPDLVISMDPQQSLYYHVAGLPADDISSVPAVVHLLCSPHIFSLFREKYLYSTAHPLSQLPGVGQNQLFNYTAVSTLAFAVAVEMGFDSIVLAGFDFAFTGMRAYVWDSFFYDYCMHNSHRFKTPGTIEMESIHKRGATRLQHYGSELEALAEHAITNGKPCVYNWRSEGTKIRHTMSISTLPREGKPFTGALPDTAVLSLPSEAIPCGKELRPLLEETLAIRNRIYRHAPSREDAQGLAHQYMHKFCDIWTRGFKV